VCDVVSDAVRAQSGGQRRGQTAGEAATISEKNTPIDRAVPELTNVERMPEAAPRRRAGTLPMIDDVFGEANMPLAAPLTKISAAKMT
jgi:hypothetical protein